MFVKESDLKVVVLGSIPMGRRFTDEQLEGLYTFTDVEVSLVEEVSTGQAPQKDNNEYYIARIKNNGGNIVWGDERSEFWSLGTGGGDTPPTPLGYENYQVFTETGLYEDFEVTDGILQVVEQ